MRIRVKLTLMEMIVVVGFIIASAVMFYYSSVIIQLKDFEIRSQKILSTLEQIELRAEGLLTTNEDIYDLKQDLTNQIVSFNKQLSALQNFKGTSFLPEGDRQKMGKLVKGWISLYDLYYIPVFTLIEQIISTPHIYDFGTIGMVNIRKELYKNRLVSNEELARLYQLEGGVQVMNMNTSGFANQGRQFMDRVRENINRSIQRSTVIAVLIAIISILSAFLVMVVFSIRLGKRIMLMHNAIQSVAEGDFSKTLTITSGDEFEEFSLHYNSLKEELWSKLDSVMDFMKEIGGVISLGNLYDLDRIIQIVIKSAVENTQADAGAVFMISEETEGVIEKRASIGYLPPLIPLPEKAAANKERIEAYEQEHPIPLGETVIGEAIINGEANFIRDTSEDESFKNLSTPGTLLYISSLAIVPLVITGRVLGAIVIAKTSKGERFTDIDFSHLKTFGDYAALTIDTMFNYQELTEKSELYREIEIASDIQKNLLPIKIPESKKIDIAAYSHAAKGVSGDYYDAFRLTDNKVAVLICDVVGKGVPAALLMVMIRTIIRLVASPRRNAEQILTILNRGITDRVAVDQFATMSFIIFNEDNGEVEYANAAHSPALHFLKRGSRFEEIDAPGLPIGIEKSEQYKQEIFQVDNGDIITLYTDGITEARNAKHDEYSQFSLQKVIKNNADSPARVIIESVKEDLNNFVGLTAQHDDQTIIVIKIK